MNDLQAGLPAARGGGLGVVLMRDPSRQALMVGFFGLLLAVLFFVFQAPDVALSQIVVGTVAVPVMALLTLAGPHPRTPGPRPAGATGERARGGGREPSAAGWACSPPARWSGGGARVGSCRATGVRRLPRRLRAADQPGRRRQRHATDVITAINFDYRALDTMGEEFILFAASSGWWCCCASSARGERRAARGARPRGRTAPGDERRAARADAGAGRAAGAARRLHRHARPADPRRRLSGRRPAAAALMIVFVAGGPSRCAAPAPHARSSWRGDRRGGYVVIGLAGLISRGCFFRTSCRSAPRAAALGGHDPAVEHRVGLEVAGALVLVCGGVRRPGAARAAASRELPAVRHRRLAVADRALRDRHQPQPGAPDPLPGGRAVLDLRAAAGIGYRTGGAAPIFADIPPGTRAVDPVVQALTLTDVVVEATVMALLLAIALQATSASGRSTRPSCAPCGGDRCTR